MKKSIKDVDIGEGTRVLLRADLNVPVRDGKVSDTFKIRALLPTLKYLIDKKAKIFMLSHLGRPKGRVVEDLRLDPVAEMLGGYLEKDIRKADDCVGPEVQAAKKELPAGELLMLENTRFHPEEKENDPRFAEKLTKDADLFVNDAFGAAHRAHASTVGVTEYLPSVAGLLLEREIRMIHETLDNPRRPYMAILGGAKIAGKIGVIRKLLQTADLILLGGGIADTFLAARGVEVGKSLTDSESFDIAREIFAEAGEKLILPIDVVVTDHIRQDALSTDAAISAVAKKSYIADIGPRTLELFKERLSGAAAIVWNGPLGVFEIPQFAAGSLGLADYIAGLDAVKVVGGGEPQRWSIRRESLSG